MINIGGRQLDFAYSGEGLLDLQGHKYNIILSLTLSSGWWSFPQFDDTFIQSPDRGVYLYNSQSTPTL